MSESRQSDARFIVLLCLPTIVGTAYFLSGVVTDALISHGPTPAISFEPPSAADRLKEAVVLTLYFASYFGAAFGPLLLPVAAWQARDLTRAPGEHRKASIAAWTIVILGVVAAAVFWGWLIRLDIWV